MVRLRQVPPYGDVAQLEEAADLSSAQYGFESLRRYQYICISREEMNMMKNPLFEIYIEEKTKHLGRKH